MKKYSKISLGILLLAVLALAGCGANKNQNQNGPGETVGAGNNSGQSITDSVKRGLFDLMTSGTGVKCTIEDPEAGQLTMFAKGDKAKVEGFPYAGASFEVEEGAVPKEERGTMINDGTWAYMWSGKKGMKFNIKEMEALAPEGEGQSNSQSSASDWKDWVKEMDEKGTKHDCSPAVLSDSDFAPPNDVQFEDWGEMIKGFMKMGEEMKNQTPGQPGALPVAP